MDPDQKADSIIIIGAGFAGLSAGIYAQMNGYKTTLFEMHDMPGGLCTAWKRKGYTIDGCIHWLVGSSPDSSMHAMWEEVGIAKGSRFINMDRYISFIDSNGRELIFYNDLNKLEKHLLAFSPSDKRPIKDFINGIRLCLHFDSSSKQAPLFKKLKKGLKMMTDFALKWKTVKRWMNTTAEEFSERFKDPMLRHAFRELWFPEFSVIFVMFTFAFLHNKNAGYPIGGSMPMSKSLESRYLQLGGTIHYKSKVDKILVKDKQAYGIRLSDGTEHQADRVISAADGYSTIFKMLRGKYGDYRTSSPYEKWAVFPPLIYVGLGINNSFPDLPHSVSGLVIQLKNKITIAEKDIDWLNIHPYQHDPTLAPENKTTMVVMIATSYPYWAKRYEDPKAYKTEKEDIARTVISALEESFPGISNQVEMTDVATPMTFERYTGNWQGSFEGWLITPQNASTVIKKMPQTINGLSNFFMCGQWVEPGGGLPTSVMSAKRLIKQICKQDRKKFVAFPESSTIPSHEAEEVFVS